MIDINVIQENHEQIDMDLFHINLKNIIDEGKAETYFEALCYYMRENDINIDENINKSISPILRSILYKEALNGCMLKEKPLHKAIEDFF